MKGIADDIDNVGCSSKELSTFQGWNGRICQKDSSMEVNFIRETIKNPMNKEIFLSLTFYAKEMTPEKNPCQVDKRHW